jgi:lipopolysaccharide export LptBFGC system permease protein LptF
MVDISILILLTVLALIIGVVLGIFIYYSLPIFRAKEAVKKAAKLIKDAEIKADHLVKNAQLDAKQTVYEMKQEADKDIKERKVEVNQFENKLFQREQSIDRRDQALMQKEKNLEEKIELQQKRMTEIDRKEEVLQLKLDSIIHELEKVSGMSTQEAKTEIDQILKDARALSPAERKKVIQRLYLRWHPDKNPDNQEEAQSKFQEINAAFEILSDPEKKKMYDQFGT